MSLIIHVVLLKSMEALQEHMQNEAEKIAEAGGDQSRTLMLSAYAKEKKQKI